jgi:hypothetical protein
VITSFTSNCLLKSIAEGVVGWDMVWIPRSVLAVSIAIICSMLGNPLEGVMLADGTSLVLQRLAPSIRALAFISLCSLLLMQRLQGLLSLDGSHQSHCLPHIPLCHPPPLPF